MCPMKKSKRPMVTPHGAGAVPLRSGRCALTGLAFFPNGGFHFPQRKVSLPPTEQATLPNVLGIEVSARHPYPPPPPCTLLIGCIRWLFITQVVEVWAGMASALRLPPPPAGTPNALLAHEVVSHGSPMRCIWYPICDICRTCHPSTS